VEKVVPDYPDAGLHLYGLAAIRTLSGEALAIQQTRYEAAATCAAGTPLEAGIGSSQVFGSDPNLNPAHRAGQRKARIAQCFARGVPEARFDYRYGFHSPTSRRRSYSGTSSAEARLGPWSHDPEGGVLIEPEYRRHRIEVKAVATRDRWNAEVRIRHTSVNAKPQVETVTCLKLRADHAEHSALISAQRWIYKDGAHARLVSRNGVDHTRRFNIAVAVAKTRDSSAHHESRPGSMVNRPTWISRPVLITTSRRSGP